MALVHEKCWTCESFDTTLMECVRVIRIKVTVGHGSGEIDLRSEPGIIPDHLDQELASWIMDAVDAWPGWKEVAQLRKQHGCAGKVEQIARPGLKVIH